MMKAFVIALFCCFATFTTFATSKEVKKCFRDYKSALENKNPGLAFRSVDSQTIKYFNKIKFMADQYNEKQLNQEDLLDIYFVLCLRNTIAYEESKRWTGKECFKFLVEQGLLNQTIFKNTEINFVEIRNDRAEAKLFYKDQESSWSLVFYRQNEQWKLSLQALLESSSKQLYQKFWESGQLNTEFLHDLVEKNTHTKCQQNIWQPLLR